MSKNILKLVVVDSGLLPKFHQVNGHKDAILQTGVSKKKYWMGTMLGHSIINLPWIIGALLVMKLTDFILVANGNSFLGVTLLFLLTVPGMLLQAYAFSFIFQDSITVQQFGSMLFQFCYQIPAMAVLSGYQTVSETLLTILAIFIPHWSLFQAGTNLCISGYFKDPYSFGDCFALAGPKNGVGKYYIMQILCMVFYGSIIYLVDNYSSRAMRKFE